MTSDALLLSYFDGYAWIFEVYQLPTTQPLELTIAGNPFSFSLPLTLEEYDADSNKREYMGEQAWQFFRECNAKLEFYGRYDLAIKQHKIRLGAGERYSDLGEFCEQTVMHALVRCYGLNRLFYPAKPTW